MYKWADFVVRIYILQVPAQFVDAILALHTKFSELITSTLGSDLAFTIALDKVKYLPNSISTSHEKLAWCEYTQKQIGTALIG